MIQADAETSNLHFRVTPFRSLLGFRVVPRLGITKNLGRRKHGSQLVSKGMLGLSFELLGSQCAGGFRHIQPNTFDRLIQAFPR